VEEPQRKYFWPAALVHYSEDDDVDDDEEEEDEDDLLSVRKRFILVHLLYSCICAEKGR